MPGIPMKIAALVVATLPGSLPGAGAVERAEPLECQSGAEAIADSSAPDNAPPAQPLDLTTAEKTTSEVLFDQLRKMNPFTSPCAGLADAVSDSVEFTSAASPAATEDPSAMLELCATTQELLDAVEPGDRTVWDRHLHADFTHLDENGVMRNKAELLEEMQPLPAGLAGKMEIDVFHVQLLEDVAVVTYEIQESLHYHGQHLRSRFRSMDTWLRTSDGWLLIGQHTAAVLKDPPEIALTRAELCEYSGTYALTEDIHTRIHCTDEGLRSERGGRPAEMYRPELRDVFFVPGQPRTRRIFLRDTQGRISGFADRRQGEDIRWRRID